MVDIRDTRATQYQCASRRVWLKRRDPREKTSIYSEDMICRPAFSRLPGCAWRPEGIPRIRPAVVDDLRSAMMTSRLFASDARPRRDSSSSLAGNVSYRIDLRFVR